MAIKAFNDFEAKIKFDPSFDKQKLIEAVSKSVALYIEQKLGSLPNVQARLDELFDRVNKLVQFSEEDKFQDLTEAKFKKWRIGDGDERLPIAFYYYFHLYAETRYSDYIDSKLFGETVSYEAKFKEKVPGKDYNEREHLLNDITKDNQSGTSGTDSLTQQAVVYNNPFKIPFFGRKKELEALNLFAKEKTPFLIWAIVGAAGSGKTSLYNAWLYNEYDKSFKASAVCNWHIPPTN
jgi:hypothetical protein